MQISRTILPIIVSLALLATSHLTLAKNTTFDAVEGTTNGAPLASGINNALIGVNAGDN